MKTKIEVNDDNTFSTAKIYGDLNHQEMLTFKKPMTTNHPLTKVADSISIFSISSRFIFFILDKPLSSGISKHSMSKPKSPPTMLSMCSIHFSMSDFVRNGFLFFAIGVGGEISGNKK